MKILSKKKKNKREKKIGMVDDWSEMSLKKMMKKEMKFVWKKKRLSEKGCFWLKMGENLKSGKNGGCSCGGLERENEVEKESFMKKMKYKGKWGGTAVKDLDRRP